MMSSYKRIYVPFRPKLQRILHPQETLLSKPFDENGFVKNEVVILKMKHELIYPFHQNVVITDNYLKIIGDQRVHVYDTKTNDRLFKYITQTEWNGEIQKITVQYVNTETKNTLHDVVYMDSDNQEMAFLSRFPFTPSLRASEAFAIETFS